MLLVDSSQYSAADRDELIRGFFSDPAKGYLAPVDGDGLMKMRCRAWDMGDGCSLINMQSSGLEVGLRPSRFSSNESPVIGFALNYSGPCRLSQDDRRQIVPAGGMYITEMNEAFANRFGRDSEAVNLQIPLEVLDIPLRDVQKAAQWLPRSPLYGLACQHLRTLSRYTEEFDAPHPSAQQAALHVLRALIKSFDAD